MKPGMPQPGAGGKPSGFGGKPGEKPGMPGRPSSMGNRPPPGGAAKPPVPGATKPAAAAGGDDCIKKCVDGGACQTPKTALIQSAALQHSVLNIQS